MLQIQNIYIFTFLIAQHYVSAVSTRRSIPIIQDAARFFHSN